MKHAFSTSVVVALLGLACGGITGGASSGAKAMCEHYEQKHASPYYTGCTAVGVGQTVYIDDFEVEVTKVSIYEESPPFIGNNSEVPAMKAAEGTMLAVEVRVTNTLPVKRAAEFGRFMWDGDGEGSSNISSPSERYMKKMGHEGWIDYWGDKDVGPNKSRMWAMTFPIHEDNLAGSLMVMSNGAKKVDPNDRRGRKKWYILESHVLDLGPPT